MMSQRDRDLSFVVGDSGGFQIQQGTRPWFDEGHPLDSVKSMLGWMEANTDCVTALDFPTGGISSGRYRDHIARIERSGINLSAASTQSGLSIAYHACLHQTILNTERMLDIRASQKGVCQSGYSVASANRSLFLVVLQGRNEKESKHWYEATKHLIAKSDGVSFAGAASRNFYLLLRRLRDMQLDGLTSRLKHIHVLGNGLLMTGVVLTSVQRNMRMYTDANDVQITHDTAEPFQRGGHQYEVYTHLIANRAEWRLYSRKLSDAQPEHFSHALNDWCWEVERDGTPRRDGKSGDGHSAVISQLGFHITVGQMLNAAQGKHKGLGVPSHEAGWAMCLHNTEAAVLAHSLAIDMLDYKELDKLPRDIVFITVLVDAFFAERRVWQARTKSGLNSKRYMTTSKTVEPNFDISDYAGVLAGRM